MDDAQFKAWLDFIRETPNEANARPAYMKMSGLRGMHSLFESGILENPATRSALKSYLEVPTPGEFKFAYPKSMEGLTADQMPPALANDVRARFSAKAADGSTVFAPNLPPDLQSYFENTKPYSIKDKWDNEAPGLAPDNLATRLNALPELAGFQPKTAARLLELGAQDPRALADVMKAINSPSNDIPAMRTLLAETIPNADDIYTVKLMLDSISAARRAYKSPAVQEAQRDLALKALGDLTGDISQDIKLGEKIDEIIKAPFAGKNSPTASRMAGNLELLARTKADPNAAPLEVAPAPVTPGTDNTNSTVSTGSTVIEGTPSDGLVSTSPAQDGTEVLKAAHPDEAPLAPAESDATVKAPGSQESTGDISSRDATAPTTDTLPAQVEPPAPTVDNLVDKMNSSEPDRVRLSAAEALKGQLSLMSDAQFQDWLKFVRQDSTEAPVRPNYMKMGGMRGLADVLNSNVLDDPSAAQALRDYLTPPKPGEFKLAYPNVLKGMTVDEMSPALLNDIRDRFSTKGPDGLIFQADVPSEMQDYLNNNARLKVTDNKGRRLPYLQPDNLDTRIAVSSQLAEFKPETAARLLELGAQDPRALADVIRLMTEPRNDNQTMRNLLSETIPNADDIYTLKLFLDSIDAARWAYSPERAQERANNTDNALRALSELTGDTAQDLRLSKDVQSIIKMKGFIKDPRPSRLADNLALGERTKPAAEGAEAAEPLAARKLEAAPPPPEPIPPANSEVEPVAIPTTALQPGEAQTIGTTIEAVPPAEEANSPALDNRQATGEPTDAADSNDTTSSGAGSRREKFNERFRKAQKQPAPGPQSQAKSAAPPQSKQGKPRVFTSLADLGQLDLSGEDNGVGNKSRDAESFGRRSEADRREEQKRRRREEGDDDN
jgi:hypothetical protein